MHTCSHPHYVMHRNRKSHFEITCTLKNGGTGLCKNRRRVREERNDRTESGDHVFSQSPISLANTVIKTKSSSGLLPPTILTSKIHN